MRTAILPALLLLAPPTAALAGGTILFDFDSARQYAPLPIDLTQGGVTAHFSATGQGFSIQRADTMGFTPVGFSGLCIYPSSVFQADLLISFSAPMTDFSILYAPQELDCDSSARMRVTAYMDAAFIGTATMTAEPGVWPTATLAIATAAPFNRVVVHYDAPPPTGGDWGPIFMADNMRITPAPVLCPADLNGDGLVDFADYLEFLNLYDAQDPAVDFNQDGLVDFADYLEFLNLYDAGC